MCISVHLVPQGLKADALKRVASKATTKGVVDIHAQEGQALTSSLSGNALPCAPLLCCALPSPALPCPAPFSTIALVSFSRFQKSCFSLPQGCPILAVSSVYFLLIRLVAVLCYAVLWCVVSYTRHYMQCCLCCCLRLHCLHPCTRSGRLQKQPKAFPTAKCVLRHKLLTVFMLMPMVCCCVLLLLHVGSHSHMLPLPSRLGAYL